MRLESSVNSLNPAAKAGAGACRDGLDELAARPKAHARFGELPLQPHSLGQMGIRFIEADEGWIVLRLDLGVNIFSAIKAEVHRRKMGRNDVTILRPTGMPVKAARWVLIEIGRA